VTLEQTSGILVNKHRAAFNALIQMFTALEYSVSWRVAKLQDWGLGQSRQRLIIFAAA
jgi:site-specific DNA-cytosine methylase